MDSDFFSRPSFRSWTNTKGLLPAGVDGGGSRGTEAQQPLPCPKALGPDPLLSLLIPGGVSVTRAASYGWRKLLGESMFGLGLFLHRRYFGFARVKVVCVVR